MTVQLHHLRCFVAIVEHGGFTDAAAELGTSQPAVSRGLAALEKELGLRLLRRTTREVVPTPAGQRILPRARRLLADLDALVHDAQGGGDRLRIGHAWAAVGRHTVEFQHRWATRHPDVELSMVRTNSPTGGLTEGACDIAVLRTPDAAGLTDARFDDAIVGLESRYAAVAADDPLAARRSLRLADLAERVVAIDPRTGTTTVDLWPAGSRPKVHEVHDVDDWLAVIASGRAVGVTAESTITQYRRHGVAFRRLRGAPPVPVRLVWWRDDPHPATGEAVGMLAELYRSPARPRRAVTPSAADVKRG
ncbi:LysR family transcriptional regulator [Mycolicibacterium madagascariense]|uniref:Probable hydrogen peroxide-inducible genes activator n=1 Tax=Mycolicibacterium madagascariense TaxID=212765 RepID=A0A7I7XLQ9_9MYCO|nr:LysR family transcriptional regulator [Mycolicibacterium madagascariense]MCV7012492.1 LysR family transcriptional regulator [Mycolicibacterium madagascariense]BBZ30169.1 LysR family transcriptional regulator [Mycolicibacterium madagascariense]